MSMLDNMYFKHSVRFVPPLLQARCYKILLPMTLDILFLNAMMKILNIYCLVRQITPISSGSRRTSQDVSSTPKSHSPKGGVFRS